MFESRLHLNLAHKKAKRDLGRFYEMHRTLTRAFVSGKSEQPPRFLWHQDMGKKADSVVLTRSEVKPNWNFLEMVEGYAGYLLTPPTTEQVRTEYGVNDRLSFRLIANPTEKKIQSRVVITEPERQLEWLRRKAAESGFELDAASIKNQEWVSCKYPTKNISILKVEFEGDLKVCSPFEFQQMLLNGIGVNKGFGCGLVNL